MFERLVKEHYQGQPVNFEVGYDEETYQDTALKVTVLRWRKSQGKYYGQIGSSRHEVLPRGRGGQSTQRQQDD